MQSNQALIPGFSYEQSISIRGLMTAFQIAMDQAFDRHFGPVQQPNPTTPSPPTQPNSLAKKKRNQKTRNQKKAKAQTQAQAQRVTIQEVEHTGIKAYVVEKVSRHVVLHHQAPWDWMATSSHGHAAISWIGMASFNEMIIIRTIGMRRMGVG